VVDPTAFMFPTKTLNLLPIESRRAVAVPEAAAAFKLLTDAIGATNSNLGTLNSSSDLGSYSRSGYQPNP
jgi:hypothetical protein